MLCYLLKKLHWSQYILLVGFNNASIHEHLIHNKVGLHCRDVI